MSNPDLLETVFNRPPRIYRRWRTETVELPEPPAPPARSNQSSWITMGMPLLTAAVLIGAMAAISQGGNALLFGVPMLVMAVMGAITTVVTNRAQARQAGREFQARRQFFEQQLHDRQDRLQELYDEEQQLRRAAHPRLEELLRIAGALGAGMLPQDRLWERRVGDPDFLEFSLGIGPAPFSSTIVVPRPHADSAIDPRLFELEQRFGSVDAVPITIALRDVGSLGLAGPRSEASPLLSALIWQAAVFHAPADLRLALVAPDEARQVWEWLPWLPHTIPLNNDPDFSARMVAHSDEAVNQLMSALLDQLSRRRDLRQQQKQNDNAAPPAFTPILLIVDGVEQVRHQPVLSEIMREGALYNMFALFLVRSWDEIPSECGAMLDLQQAGPRWARAGQQWSQEPFSLDTAEATPRQSYRLAKTLAPLRLAESGSNQDVPRNVRLFDLLDIKDEQDLLPPSFWSTAPRPDRGWHSDVPLGKKVGAQPLLFDLYQHAHGSHGIIAGATGAGKSVLLQSVIAALAITHTPMQLQLLLIDFKGGASLAKLAELPHTAGFVTDLEGRLAERAMIAIKSELRHRKLQLRLAAEKLGTKIEDLKDYREHAGHGLPPLSNLLIVIDEFDEMVQSYKEFVAELVRVVKQGRSLGVHLLVASQQPAKAVTGDIRTQLKYFIALRLGSSEDSREMLQKPDAAFLPPDIPGRAYFRVGSDSSLFQVAQVSGTYRPKSEELPALTGDDDVVIHHLEPELPAPGWQPPASGVARRETDLDVLVRALGQAGADLLRRETARGAWQPRPIWQPPLPAHLPLSRIGPVHSQNLTQLLAERWGRSGRPNEWLRLTLGCLDIPQESRQEPLQIGLNDAHLALFGASGSGKTMALRTLLLSLALTHSPADAWCYIIDAGGQGLSLFAQLPQVGAVIQARDRARVRRLFAMVEREILRRQELFRAAGVQDLPAYRREQQSLPAWLIVIDKIALLREEFKDRHGHEAISEELIRIARVGRSYGIHLVISADGPRDLSHQLLSLLDTRITLRLPEIYDYNELLGGRVISQIPATLPGRGLAMRPEHGILELQIALPVLEPPREPNADQAPEADDEQATLLDSELNTELRETIGRIKALWTGQLPAPVELLPEQLLLTQLNSGDERPADADGLWVPIGKESLNLGTGWMRFDRATPHNLVVGGRRSGKTTALTTALAGLARRYSPDELGFVIVDSARRGLRTLQQLPHTESYAVSEAQIQALAEQLGQRHSARRAGQRRLLIVVDDYDIGYKHMESQFKAAWEGTNLFGELKRLSHEGGELSVHLLVAANIQFAEESGELIRALDAGRNGLILWPHKYDGGTRLLDVRLPLGERDEEQPRGRALLVAEETTSMVQIALAPESDREEIVAQQKHEVLQ